MDESSIERMLGDAPRPEFGDGHAARLARRSRGRPGWWRAVAALVAIGGGVWLIVAASRGGERAPERVHAVTVYWNRASSASGLDIRRWNCEGCGRDGAMP